MQGDFEKLNSAQRLAVETIEGPVLVVAGPGTGKTQIISQRIINILQKTDTNPENILCLTFTDNAATNMRKRLLTQLKTDAYKVKIATFHSFCNEVIADNPAKFQRHKELIQIDAITKIRKVKESIDTLPKDKYSHNHLTQNTDKYFYTQPLIQTIETFKKEGWQPQEVLFQLKELLEQKQGNPQLSTRGATKGQPTKEYQKEIQKLEKAIEATEIATIYQQKLEEVGLYDFSDMIMWVIEKFQEDNDLLLDYQEKYQYILVDEYQDTNGAQNQLLFLLGQDHPENNPNIFVVGDDDQSIYRFQGANVGNLIEFTSKFNAQVITVDTNYRSTQKILDIADAVIQNNQERLSNQIANINKKLKQGNEKVKTGEVKIIELNTDLEEVEHLTSEIRQLIDQGNDPTEIAVLYRKHNHAEELVENFLKNKIPFHLQKGRNALEEETIKGFISLLKIINAEFNPDFDTDLIKTLSLPYLNIDQMTIFKLNLEFGKQQYTRSQDIAEILKEKSETILEKIFDNINSIKNQSLVELTQKFVAWNTESKQTNAYSFIQKVAEETGFLNFVFNSQQEVSLEDLSSITSFFDSIKQNCRINTDLKLSEWLNTINEMQEAGVPILERELDTDVKGVKLMTIHSSKGLEFEHVFLLRCTDEAWEKARGATKSISLPQELYGVESLSEGSAEEIRRLFFVGVTRAKSHLTFTYANTYQNSNGEKSTLPSQFLAEIPSELVLKVEKNDATKTTVDSLRNYLTPSEYFASKTDEEELLSKLVESFKLSASALNSYMKCPLKFKMESLLKIPSGSYKDKFNLSVGNAIHSSLEAYYRNIDKGQTSSVEIANFVLKRELQKELYTKEELEQLLQKAEKLLNQYFAEKISFHDQLYDVEKWFGYRNPIYIDIEGQQVEIAGKIDRIDNLGLNESGNKYNLRVVDYKVSAPKSLNTIKGNNASGTGDILRQLVFYKLLVENDSSFLIKGKAVVVTEFQIIFINEDMRLESVPISAEEIQQTKGEMKKVYTSIKNLDFHGSEDNPLCGECEWCLARASAFRHP